MIQTLMVDHSTAERLGDRLLRGRGNITCVVAAGSVYLIDTKIFGFDRYHSAFIVAGDEVALIDTGAPSSWDVVRQGMAAHGFVPRAHRVRILHRVPILRGGLHARVRLLMKDKRQAALFTPK
jgi:glyoxylase-like metal-dependent hydrolase (beta-lactamase superfamily II)